MTTSFPTSLETADIPDIYERFAVLIGEQSWTKQILRLKEEIRGNPFLRDYLRSEHEISFALERCRERLRRREQLADLGTSTDLYSAAAFAAQSAALIENAPLEARAGLVNRIRAALREASEMRGIRLEFATATHFAHQGHPLEWPEQNSAGRVDLFIRGLGAKGLEVECKAISEDKGRKIHRRDVLMLNNAFRKSVQGFVKALKTGLSLVLTVPNQLPSSQRERDDLVASVRRAILMNEADAFPDGSTLTITEFQPRDHALFDEANQPIQETIDRLTKTRNENAAITINKTGTGAIVFVVKSGKDDTTLGHLIDTMKFAAERQMSRACAGLIVVGIDSLSESELRELSAHDRGRGTVPTLLRLAAHHVLQSDARTHIIGVCYVSREAQDAREANGVRTYGGAYYFPNQNSPHWHDDFAHVYYSRRL